MPERIFLLSITPKAKKTDFGEHVEDEKGQRWQKVSVAAPAENGKANAELLKFLSKQWNITRSSLEIVSGDTSCYKKIRLREQLPEPLPRPIGQLYMDMSMNAPTVITTTSDLAAYCESHVDAPLLAIDTEFIRENTYHPKLCLIQIAAGESDAVAIDTVADDLDLTLLKTLFEKNKGLKLFHAGKQDLEILSRMLGFVPTPMFDTQVAAQLLGFGDQVGYEALVRDILGKSLDKSQQYTNWSRRPLTDKQLVYALNDVLFLRELYPVLLERLKQKNRFEWMQELMQPLTDVAYYRNAPEDAWRRMSRRSRHTSYLARLRTLAEFREIEAEERDLPRQWIFTDDTLQDLALHPPKTAEALKKIRLGKNASQMTYDGLIGAIEAADPSRFDGSDLFAAPLTVQKQHESLFDLLKLVLKVVAEEENISPRLLATSDDLIEITLGKSVDQVLCGWRYAMVGKQIAALLEGKLSLKIQDNGKITLEAC